MDELTSPLYPSGVGPYIVSIASILVGSSILPVAFSPSSYTAVAASGPFGLVYSLGNYLISQAAAIGGFGANGLRYAIKYAWILLFLALTFQGSVILNNYDNLMYQKLDKGMTKYVLPAYRDTGLPIAKFANVVFDTGVCWVDLALMARSVAITDTVKVLVNCTQQDWQTLVNHTFEFVTNTLAIPVYFIQEDGRQAFQFAPALYSLALTINSTQPSFRCMCDELDFLYDIIFDTVVDTNLSYALDAAANSVFYYPLNITVQAIVMAFGNANAAYICNQANVTQKIDCVIHRPPYFIPLRESLCNFSDYTALFLENTIDTIISQFLDYNGRLLVFNKILSSGTCISMHFIIDLLDLLSRIDMVFDSQVQYMRHWAFNDLINIAHRFAAGVGEFFYGFENYYTDQVGVIFENIFIIAGNSINIFKDFMVAVFYTIYDTGSVIQFFQNFDSDQFSIPYYNIKGATFNLTDAINEDFSIMVMTIFTTGEDTGKIFYNIVTLLAQNPSLSVIEEYIITDLPPLTDAVAIDIHAVFVTFANFIRQFDDTCMPSAYNPPFIMMLDVNNPDTVCQLADIIETIGQLIRTLWIQFSDTIYQLEYNIVHNIPISGYGPFLQSYSDWLHTSVEIVYDNLIDSIGAFVGSWFQDIECPCVSQECSTGNEGITSVNVRGNIRLLISAYFDATAGTLYYGITFFVDALLAAVDLVGSASPSDLSNLLCIIVKGFMDFIGRIVYIFKTFADFVDCLLGTNGFHINLFSGTMYYLLFDPNNSNSARNMVCSVIDDAIQAIQFLVGVITGGFTYIGELITQGAKIVGNTIIDLVNTVFVQLNTNVITKINDAINTVLGGLRSIVCFINRIIGIFSCLRSINISISTMEFDIDIPSFGTPAIHIDVGLFAFDIPAIPIDIPSFPIFIPLPDVSSITSAINCLSSNFNNFNSGGCANTCGPTGISGGIYPSFCTGSIVIPQVPEVPPITKRSESTFAYFNDSGEIQQSNDTLVNTVFTNYTMVFCGSYYNLSTDETISEKLRGYFAQQYIQCALSAQMMFMVNFALFRNETKDWLNPLSLTSVGYTALSGISLAYKFYHPVYNEFNCYGSYFETKLNYNQSLIMTNNCMNWTEYYTKNNLTSPFSYKVGEFLETLREALYERWTLNSTYGFSDFLSGIWNTLSTFYDRIFVLQPGVANTLYDSLWHTVNAYNNESIANITIKRFITEHVYKYVDTNEVYGKRFTPSLKFNRTLDSLSHVYGNISSKWAEFLRPKTTKTVHNRAVMWNIYYVMSMVYKEYSHKYNLFKDHGTREEYLKERNEEVLYSTTKVDYKDIDSLENVYHAWKHATPLGRDKITKAMELHVDVARGKRLELPPNFFGNGSDICGIPVPGGGSTCINCTILKVLLDDFVSRVLECVSISQVNLNLLESRYFKPFRQLIPNPFRRMNSQTNGVFEEWVNEHLNGNYTDMVLNHGVMRQTDTGPQDGPSYGVLVTPTEIIGDLFDGWVSDLASSIFQFDFSFKEILTNIKNYLIAETTAIGNTLYDWVDNFVSIPVTMNCETLSERGIGIGNLLLSALLVSLFMIAIIAILARLSSSLLLAFTPVILMWPGIILVVNYGVSPLQLPAVPFCLADDIYEILEMGNVDCVPITSILDGITTSTCPTSSTDYERDFLRCSEDPYLFNNPWRLLYFALDYVWPSFMNTLRTSNTPLISLLRSIDGMYEMMQFDYPPGEPTSDYTSCFVSRSYNAATFGVYLGALSTLSGASALSLVIILTFIGTFTYSLGLTSLWIAMQINGQQIGQQSSIVHSTEDYLVENLKGSRTYNERPVAEIESRTGISFSESRKQKKPKPREVIRQLSAYVTKKKYKLT